MHPLINTKKKTGRRLSVSCLCILMAAAVVAGCGSGGLQARQTFQEANDLYYQGNYQAALSRFERLIQDHPEARDRLLFEMGIIYSHPKNGQKDYRKSLDCFQRLIREYPGSEYRRDSEMMVFSITTVTLKDRTISAQQTQIESLRHEVKSREDEIAALRQTVQSLERMAVELASRKRTVDRILIEKRERRLTLLSKDEKLKTYRIALGGSPDGPKERQGDNKTPEGIYSIDSKNGNSSYHLALHISYPNERDKKRSKERGVCPGGDIMIHGLKKEFSWVGQSQADVDWTRGCIAVTDAEIEEIYRLVPVGTAVEIRP